MEKNIKKKKVLQVLKAVGKLKAKQHKAKPGELAGKLTKDEVKLHNRVAAILNTMPKSKGPQKVVKQVVKAASGVKQVVKPKGVKAVVPVEKASRPLKGALALIRKLGKVDNLKVTRSSRGKIIGINYDYSSPSNRNFIRVSLTNDTMVVHCRQLITQLEVTTTRVGEILFQTYINPNGALAGEREKRFASCFDKYDMTYVSFSFNPAAATTVSGNFFAGFDFDPTQYYPQSQDGLDKLLTKPGSHDCIYYGGGKESDYHWTMPSYPGKKPTFFIDQTDTSGSGIRFANEAQFIMMNGFGIKSADLGTMGSLWGETTTVFYDPYIQNIEGTQSTFLWDDTISSLNWAAEDSQQLVSIMKTVEPSSTGGVEWGDVPGFLVSGTQQQGYYVPPGVWDVDMMFNSTCSLEASGLTAASFMWLELMWWNVTKNNWVDMITTPLPEGNPAYHGNYITFGNFTATDAVNNLTGPRCGGSGRFVIPNDGLDYYIAIRNHSTAVDQSGVQNRLDLTVLFDAAKSYSHLQFNWHAPTDYESAFLMPSANMILADRISALEKKLATPEEKRRIEQREELERGRRLIKATSSVRESKEEKKDLKGLVVPDIESCHKGHEFLACSPGYTQSITQWAVSKGVNPSDEKAVERAARMSLAHRLFKQTVEQVDEGEDDEVSSYDPPPPDLKQESKFVRVRKHLPEVRTLTNDKDGGTSFEFEGQKFEPPPWAAIYYLKRESGVIYIFYREPINGLWSLMFWPTCPKSLSEVEEDAEAWEAELSYGKPYFARPIRDIRNNEPPILRAGAKNSKSASLK